MTSKLEDYWERRELEEQRRLERLKLRMGKGKREHGLGVAKELKIRGKRCRVCGSRYSIEAHHVVHRSRIGSSHPLVHHPDNLMPVCHQHHQDHHSTTKRIPLAALLPAEREFLERHGGPAWSERWYPRSEG